MHILLSLYRLRFTRNILGAFAGAAVAMTLYGVYGVGHQVVASMLPVEQKVDTSKDDAARTAKVLEVGARAKAILEQLH
jgi:hypothetical protein